MRRCRRTGGAKGATLTFMAGGDAKAFAAAKADFGSHGQEDRALRRGRRRAAARSATNMILGISMIAVGEAFALAGKAGVVASGAVRRLLDVVGTMLGG